MRLNEFQNNVVPFPQNNREKNKLYVIPVHIWGTLKIQSHSSPTEGWVELEGTEQRISNSGTDISVEALGNGEYLIMAEAYGNVFLTGYNYWEVEKRIRNDYRPILWTDAKWDFLNEASVEIAGTMAMVDFDTHKVMYQERMEGEFHAAE